MFRSIPFIIAALAEVGITGATARVYAPILQEEGKKRHFDPVTVIVLIAGESSGRTKIVNPLGCVGLGQVCLSNYKVCQKGNKPDTYNVAKCEAKKRQLQHGPSNLRAIAAGFSANRKFCNEKTNKRTKKTRNRWRHWLPSYGGYNNYKGNNVWCGQKKVKGKWKNVAIPKRIKGYMERRKRIVKAVSRKLSRRRERKR